MTIPPNPHPEQVEALALVILNSDRSMAGLPPVDSRGRIPDSDGYVANATAVLASLANRPADDGEPRAWMRRWFFDRNEGSKGNRPRGWTLHECTPAKLLPDDVPLYAPPLQPEGVKRP